jgi:16S rRNA (guanine527-N7)-methyltransferase
VPIGPDDHVVEVPSSLLEVLEDARAQDLLGAMALPEQVDHALGFARAFEGLASSQTLDDHADGHPGPRRWLDLGSGGGLPGLVLAQYWPDSQAVLLDAAERRTAFLATAVERLSWQRHVSVVRARAEEAGARPELRGSFDVVWARSFGSPPVTAECAAPFLRVGGLLVVSEPPAPEQTDAQAQVEAQMSDRWPREGLAQLGQEPLVTLRSKFGYQVILQAAACPERFPRRLGVAAKRPLYRVSHR